MRSDLTLALVLALGGATGLAGCAKPIGDQICRPTSSWASPAYRCTAPAVAAAPEPEPPVVEAPPDPDPEPEPVAVVQPDTIELREQVQFETNSPVLLERSKQVLDEVVTIMTDHPEIKVVEVHGHTDDQGTNAKNQHLSDRRAAAVRTYLVSKGVAKQRLRSKGFGETQPIADNTTDDGRALNRRVELRILERD